MERDEKKPAVNEDGAAGNKQQERRPVSEYQASPEEQAWFARTFSSDVVFTPIARHRKPPEAPKGESGNVKPNADRQAKKA